MPQFNYCNVERHYAECRCALPNDPMFKGSNKASVSTFGLYYKPMMIVNDDFRVINKLEASPTDDARVIIYDHHMFIVQAPGQNAKSLMC